MQCGRFEDLCDVDVEDEPGQAQDDYRVNDEVDSALFLILPLMMVLLELCLPIKVKVLSLLHDLLWEHFHVIQLARVGLLQNVVCFLDSDELLRADIFLIDGLVVGVMFFCQS